MKVVTVFVATLNGRALPEDFDLLKGFLFSQWGADYYRSWVDGDILYLCGFVDPSLTVIFPLPDLNGTDGVEVEVRWSREKTRIFSWINGEWLLGSGDYVDLEALHDADL